jgi:hypothetical protein
VADQTDELDEFNKLSSTKLVDSVQRMLKSKKQKYVNNEEEEEGPARIPGRLVQYACMGDKFSPITSTVRTLPPGVYSIAMMDGGRSLFSPHEYETDTLLRLPDSRSSEVVAEIQRFWTLKESFKKHGFTHKRGFLLWGPAGSGKTSTVSLVIEDMVQDGGVVILGTGPGTAAAGLAQFRQVEPERPVVVILEDIDTIIDEHGESSTLSLLDGETSIGNVVFIATTNYPEKLDGRVVNRPSRFDKVVKIGMPSPEARAFYLQQRNLDLSEGDLDRWVSATDGFSIAHVKELIVGVKCFGNSFDDEIKRLRAMARPPKSGSDREAGFGKG